MPSLKSSLSEALPEVLKAAVHSAAALVLHVTGDRRLDRHQAQQHIKQLRLLLELSEKGDRDAPVP